METNLMNQVAEELAARGYDARVISIPKNNMMVECMTLKTDSSKVSPVFYQETLKGISKPGMTIDDIADAVLSYQSSFLKDAPDVNFLHDREYILDNMRLSVCKTDWNQKLLDDIPHRKLEGTDLDLYPRVILESGSMRPTYGFLDSLDISGDDAFEAARKNSEKEYTVMSMMDVMAEILGEEPEELPVDTGIAIVSNENKIHGASAIVSGETLEKAREMIGAEKIYIIPSSIHELLVVDADNIDANELRYMISDINESMVDEQDRLSDHPYYYDGRLLSMDNPLDRQQKQQTKRFR